MHTSDRPNCHVQDSCVYKRWHVQRLGASHIDGGNTMLFWIAGSCSLPPPPSNNEPPPPNTPWFRGPNDHCRFCDKKENLESCGICGLPVCGQHRWGTGSLGDGYYCLRHETYELPLPEKEKALSRWQRYKFMAKADPLLATVCGLAALGSLLALLLSIVQITLALLGLSNWPRH